MWNPFRARRERALRRMASVLLARPDGEHYGFDTMQAAGISSGAMYPLLTRMVLDGWLEDGWEYPDPQDRPRRRWYRLTELGRLELSALVDEEVKR